jgi:pimeloyl-ACP methyl ester carboxylesterase
MQTAFLIAILVVAALALWTLYTAAKAASRHPPTGIFLPVTGGRLHLRDMGPRDAPPERTIVMLHGASCNLLALTLPLAGPLSKSFRVIAIDRPGHGHSDRPGGRAASSVTRQAALIAEGMAKAGAPRAIVLAHSFSGALGLTLALDHPERVAGLVLIGPVSHRWPGGITWYYHVGSWPVIGWIFSHLLPVPGAALTMQSGVNGVFAPQKPPPDYVEQTALPLLLRPANFMANAEDVAGLYAHVTERSQHYHRITSPAVVISGEDDRTVYTSIHTAALGRELPDVTVHVLKGVGHVPHHAATDFVVGEIEALAARLATSPEKTAG